MGVCVSDPVICLRRPYHLAISSARILVYFQQHVWRCGKRQAVRNELYSPHSTMFRKRRSQPGPMPCTTNTKWSTCTASSDHKHSPSAHVTQYTHKHHAQLFHKLTFLLLLHQQGHPACKTTEWWGAGVVICLERGADLHMAQLMPLPLTVSCFSKIQIGFTFLVLAHPGSPGQRAVKRVCVCVVVLVLVGPNLAKSTSENRSMVSYILRTLPIIQQCTDIKQCRC